MNLTIVVLLAIYRDGQLVNVGTNTGSHQVPYDAQVSPDRQRDFVSRCVVEEMNRVPEGAIALSLSHSIVPVPEPIYSSTR